MDRNLYDYLKSIVSLEKSMYTQTETINQMKNEIDDLGIIYEIEKPQEPIAHSSDVLGSLGGSAQFGAIVGGIVGLFNGNFLISIIFGALIGVIISFLLAAVSDNAENSRREKQYDAEIAAYNLAVDEDDRRVKRELVEKARLCEILDMMEEKRDETENLLNQYYATDIIFPKYRNLIAMCSIYEYFVSGSCDTLKEAYNKYDTEVLFKQIMTKLDEVVQQLDSIKGNQYMLYDAIQEGNRISQRLVSESVRQAQLIEKSIDYQALQANYSAQIANEVQLQNQLTIYEAIQRDREKHFS